jgi:hypothetical protein
MEIRLEWGVMPPATYNSGQADLCFSEEQARRLAGQRVGGKLCRRTVTADDDSLHVGEWQVDSGFTAGVLHGCLVARVNRRLMITMAATPGPWEHEVEDNDQFRGCGQVYTMGDGVLGGAICAPSGDLYPRGGYSPFEDMCFIADHDPEDAKRRHHAALRVLARHSPDSEGMCHHSGGVVEFFPCEEIVDLAAAYDWDLEQVPSD